ncbi:hypothetical protein TSAR_007102 [Trichomalopsis sarcophagae]|uniref:N-acetyltransferase domain-containing protein n=1 Tax=Trichomalopsis sarcophagae TaxID=543379 RepID=A0A232EV68_9HYME|nr:hypothetical protein TSAR_007102 [Trichomalopsis sarcophagae]
MEHPMLVDSGRETDSQNDELATPIRAQKRLFASSINFNKRSLSKEERENRRDEECISDAESDLGPMSPLALTDHSSCDSSPGRQFISPLATPEKSPIIPFAGHLNPNCISPFSSLRRVTRSARFSPRRIFASPKSKSSSSSQTTRAECNVTSSDEKEDMLDEVVPETPGKDSDFDDQQSYVAETPQKEEYTEQRLITPLGSVCKTIPIPRIHRRKSLGALDFDESSSPEIKTCSLKRHIEDTPSPSKSKFQKTDEFILAPRARAALFQEKKAANEKEKGFTLNPRSFYGSGEKSRKSFGPDWREPQPEAKKRRSLPAFHHNSHKRAIRKPKKGEINCGVGHGIRRPKPKRQSLHNVTTKTEKQNETAKSSVNESKENLNPQHKTEKTDQNKTLTPEVVNNKKFFKSKPNHNAVCTVNDKIKLRIALNQKDAEHTKKKAKLDSISFDTADLTVDEPYVEEQTKVASILKILEDDWADDDYDTMETAQSTCSKINTQSPKKSNIPLKNLTMSPGSELSSMTSTMNIEDAESNADENAENVFMTTEVSTQKFYPLFTKGYSSNVNDLDGNPKKRKRNTSWQLSSKSGNADNQYQIDAGQKMFGATQCNECGIIYHIGDPDDENAHLNYHNSFKILKFQGWKNERVVFADAYSSSRIILVEPKDSNLYWKKVTEVLEVVDRDLGLSDMKLSFYRDKKVYMYVRDKTILGVLVAEVVKSAFQMIPELIELNCCTTESKPVKCGVNVVWTAMSHRRQGIATKLVDTLRATYYYGYIMSIDDIAFSTPTPSGKQFAEKYTKTRNFKVY